MIYEHLIEPAVVAEIAKNRRNFRDFIQQFSESSPRVISNFPRFKVFRKMAYNALPTSASEVTKQRLDELIAFIREAHRVERDCPFDGAMTWQDNANQAADACFVDFALVQKEKPETFSGQVISFDDFEQGLDVINGQAIVEKEVSKMGQALGNLLRLSHDITFVDPYFNSTSKVWDLFIALVEKSISDSPNQATSIRVIYSSEKANLPAPQHLFEKFRDEHDGLFAELDNIEFMTIESKPNGEAIHNRYLITDLAALSLGFGFDARGEGQTDDVSLLGKLQYETRYVQYVESTAFTVVERVSKT